MPENHQKTVFNSSVNAGSTATVDIPVGSASTMVVAWTQTNASAVGDLGATSVKMFAPGITAPLPGNLPVVSTIAATFASPVASKVDTYDVRGHNKVRLSITNAAGAARTTKVHVYTQ